MYVLIFVFNAIPAVYNSMNKFSDNVIYSVVSLISLKIHYNKHNMVDLPERFSLASF